MIFCNQTLVRYAINGVMAHEKLEQSHGSGLHTCMIKITLPVAATGM